MTNALPDLSSKVVEPTTGRLEPIWATYLRKLQNDVASALSALTGDDDEVAVVYADKEQVLTLPSYIELPDDQDYLFSSLGITGTITSVVTECVSGSCTLTVLIGSTALGGSSNSVSTTRATEAHTSNNAIAATDDLTIRVSGNSSCEGLSVTIKGSQTLD